VVGATGYAVYEGGKGAVSVTGSAASGVAGAAKSTVGKSGKKDFGEVVFDGAVLDAVCPYNVATVTAAGRAACTRLRFASVSARGDGLAATVTAEAADGETVTIEVEAMGPDESRAKVRYGEAGDFTKSELIFGEMVRILESQKN
jgi:hypothetical protein